jgi:hypothetical protein
LRSDGAVRADLAGWMNLCGGVQDGGGVNGHSIGIPTLFIAVPFQDSFAPGSLG